MRAFIYMRILAFNIAHDSSVCVINNGIIEYFCKEERLSRVKRDKHPFKALELYKSLNLGKVDYALYSVPSNDESDIEITYKHYIRKMFGVELENFSSLLHHSCHANLAYYNSRFDTALVFVIDRNGSIFFVNRHPAARESESVFLFTKNTSKAIYKRFWLNDNYQGQKLLIARELEGFYPDCDIIANTHMGIVKVYEAATTLIGQNDLENGKTMGLSAYGKNDLDYKLFDSYGNPLDHLFTTAQQTCFLELQDKTVNKITTDNYEFYAGVAKQVQLQTQFVVKNLIEYYVNSTNIKNVCIVGGYGLNIVANNYYIKSIPGVNFYFEPISDDTGVPIGAAMLKYNMLTNKVPKPIDNSFFHYYNYNEPLTLGNKTTLKELCELLANKQSLAIFEGQPESGPRALGHRSILFDPRNLDGKDLVNKIKQREWYRPFAAVVLESEFTKYFDTLGLDKSRDMTINFDVKPEFAEYIPSVIHVDNTCRVQTVSHGFLFELLLEFFNQTGCPILLNTSLNLAGEPLAQTKNDAINIFNNSSLDAIYFVDDNKLIKKAQ